MQQSQIKGAKTAFSSFADGAFFLILRGFPGAARKSDRHLRAELDDAIRRNREEVSRIRRLPRQRDEKPVLLQRHARIGGGPGRPAGKNDEYQTDLYPADQFMASAEAPPPALIERFRLDQLAPHPGAISLGRQAPHCHSRPCMVAAAMLEGLPPNRTAHVMRLSCGEAEARRIAAIIVETFDPATTAAAAFENTPDASSSNNAPWIVEAYFGDPPDEANVRALVGIVADAAAARATKFGRVNECDWVAASLEGLKPVRAGRFLIHGAHGRDAVKANDIAIEIEAALAFGTGHHGSTRGCLHVLELVARERRPRFILDLGTGSGVLAIAAAKLFKRKIHAGDIDPICVKAAGANANRNHVAGFVRPVLAKGAAHPLLRAGGPYELVLANILAHPLRDLAPQIAALAAPRADIILSGLIGRDVAGVAAAYGVQGIALARRIDIDGWATLLMRRGGRRRQKP
jgi:ribosomal protein L11 methyltransferase